MTARLDGSLPQSQTTPPPDGAVCIIASSGELLIRRRGAWQRTACCRQHGNCHDLCPLLTVTARAVSFGCAASVCGASRPLVAWEERELRQVRRG